jgi:integrase
MPKKISTLHVLTVRELYNAQTGELNDGGGLLFRITAKSSSAVMRFTSPTTSKRREMGLGPCRRGSLSETGDSLVAARKSAADARELIRQGIDPLEQRKTTRILALKKIQELQRKKFTDEWTLERASRDYYQRVIQPTRTPKHAAQWIASLENHIPKTLWQKPITEISPPEIFDVFESAKPHKSARNHRDLSETMRRIRQRIDAVFEDAIFYGKAVANPANAVKRKLTESKPVRKGHFRALEFKFAPQAVAKIRSMPGNASRCLEFAILTISRTSEALEARWSEFDLEAGIWRLPADRTKTKEPHTVFLSQRAIQILRRQLGQDNYFVFPSGMPSQTGKPMSNMSMLKVLDRTNLRALTTVHGLRSTFSTWANETAAARPDVIEACLSHTESDKTRRAYNRAEFIHERKQLMNKWAEYLDIPQLKIAVG